MINPEHAKKGMLLFDSSLHLMENGSAFDHSGGITALACDFWYRMGGYGAVSFNSTKEVKSCVSHVERYRRADVNESGALAENESDYKRRLKRKAERQVDVQSIMDDFVEECNGV